MRAKRPNPDSTAASRSNEKLIKWPSDSQSRRIAAVAQVAQVAAIGVAGLWGGYVWIKTSLPSTETGVQTTGETSVVWSPTHESCKATFRLIIENIGTNVVTLAPVRYSIAPVPSARLADSDDFRILTSVEPLSEPKFGELLGMSGSIRPKEKRFKEVWFIFRPDRSRQYTIEVVIDDNKPDVLSKWHAEVESCDPPSLLKKKD